MKLPELPVMPMKTFYKWGAILMTLSAVGNIYSLSVMWDVLNIGSQASSIAGILFNALLAVLFGSFYKQEVDKIKIIESPEIDNLLKELNNNGGSNEQK